MQRWLRRQSNHRRSRSWAGASSDDGASDGQSLIGVESGDPTPAAPDRTSSTGRGFSFSGRGGRERTNSRESHPAAAAEAGAAAAATPITGVVISPPRGRASTYSTLPTWPVESAAAAAAASTSTTPEPAAAAPAPISPPLRAYLHGGDGDSSDSSIDVDDDLDVDSSIGVSARSRSAGAGSEDTAGPAMVRAAVSSGEAEMNDATTQTAASAPHIRDSDVIAELHRTVIQDNANQLVKLLVGSEIDANSTFTRTERPILHVAASLGAHDCLCYLIRLGADVNKQDSAGRTALHLAARNGHRQIIETLVKQFDADVGIADNEGYTAMHWLASNGHLNYLDLLLSVGPGVNFQDHAGRTPLHVACHGGHATCAQYLVQKGADIHCRDHTRRDALYYACKVGAVDCCDLLIRLGAKLVNDTADLDAFNVSLHGRHTDCAASLIKAFPQLLARIVHIGAIRLYDVDVVSTTLRKYTGSGVAAHKVTAEAVAQLTATEGQQLLSLANDEAEHGEPFVRVVRVLHVLLEATRDPAIAREKSARQQQLASVNEAAEKIVRPMWDQLGAWLDLMLVDIEAVQRGRPCISAGCRAGGPCYSPSCTVKIEAKAKRKRRIGGLVTELREGLPAQAASRVVTMLSAFHTLYKRSDGKLDPAVHSFFAAHRRVITWLIARDVSVLFQRLNFILGHDCLHHLFRDAIRSEPFESRREWFYEHIDDEHRSIDPSWSMPVLTITRKSLFHSSCELFLTQQDNLARDAHRDALDDLDGPPSQYVHKQPFAIRFDGEPGIGDGVKREWFELLVREILNPDYGLFATSADQTTYQPNPDSSVNPDHLSYLEFAGRIVGLAVFHRHPLSIHFTRSFYKHMLGKPAHLQDAESLDPEYMQSINWILENDISDAGLDLNFSTEHQSFGKTESVELLPGGADIPVTDENKHGYVHLLVAQKLDRGIRKQIASFCKGLWSFVPRALLSLFDEFELELLISGIPTIDIEDWRANCAYSGYTDESPTVKLFWEVMNEFEQPERALVLQFSTGSSRVPIGGFSKLGGESARPFTLSHDEDAARLPSASTCFNLLRLPAYSSAKVLRGKLLLALQEATEGFAFS